MAPSTSSKLGSSRISGRLSLAPPALSPKPGSPASAAAVSDCSAASPGNSPEGNSPRSPGLPAAPAAGLPEEAVAEESLALDAPLSACEPSLLEACSWLELPLDWLELLDEELLDEELLEEDSLGGGGGVDGVVLGVDGVCGAVGVLALGQPPSNRQAQAIPASFGSVAKISLRDVISPDKFFCLHWLPRFIARAEYGFAQFAHQAVGLVVSVSVAILAHQVGHPALGADPEF